MLKLSAAHAEWRPPTAFNTKGKYQEAMDKFFGRTSRRDRITRYFRGRFGPGALEKNIRRAKNVEAVPERLGDILSIELSCADPDHRCIFDQDAVVVALTRTTTSPRKIILLCPAFFDDRLFKQLKDVDEEKKNEISQIRVAGMPPTTFWIDDWLYTKAATLLHEIYHWEQVAKPLCVQEDELYDLNDIVEAAQQDRLETTMLNRE